ncbi:MAG: hypothetical protein ACREIC_10690 [Limisphaerales bacterium]
MSYWDTSTLVKLYAKEPDSAVFEGHAANPLNAIVGETELVATDKRMRDAAKVLKLALFPV